MKPLSILVVDDNDLVGELLAELLTANGHTVCAVVGTEDDAVEAADRCAPDLVILDVRLRAGNGINAMERMAKVRLVPSVFISGMPAPDGRPVLQKPFREAELLHAIAHAMQPQRAATVPPISAG